MSTTNSKSKGFSLIELVLAVALFMIYAGGLAVAATSSHLTRLENAELLKAQLLFEEGWEAIRSIRNEDFAQLTNGDHGLSYSGSSWAFSGGFDITDEDFIRTVSILNVRRNTSGDIVQSGGEVDPDTKEVHLEITWTPIQEKDVTITSQSYLTNYVSPDVWPPAPPES